MFRNQYDNDVTTWSPQGRLHQLEYAMEAVKQGSAAVGVKSKTHAILASLKRAPSELSAYQKKTFEIDDHVGITIAGLTADARTLSRFMQTECMNHKYAYDQQLPVSRLVTMVGNRLQRSTIGYGRRPFGVGILVAGYDERGPHIFEIEPSSNFFNSKAQAIGARSQSARTYLERNLDKFPDSSVDELARHALRALRDCLPAEVELNAKNLCLSIVGADRPFTTYDGDELRAFIDAIDEGDAPMEAEGAAAAAADDDAATAPMAE